MILSIYEWIRRFGNIDIIENFLFFSSIYYKKKKILLYLYILYVYQKAFVAVYPFYYLLSALSELIGVRFPFTCFMEIARKTFLDLGHVLEISGCRPRQNLAQLPALSNHRQIWNSKRILFCMQGLFLAWDASYCINKVSVIKLRIFSDFLRIKIKKIYMCVFV